MEPREQWAQAERAMRANIPDCGWKYGEVRYGGKLGSYYSTGCGEEVDVPFGSCWHEDLQWVYCPHCGGKIVGEED